MPQPKPTSLSTSVVLELRALANAIEQGEYKVANRAIAFETITMKAPILDDKGNEWEDNRSGQRRQYVIDLRKITLVEPAEEEIERRRFNPKVSLLSLGFDDLEEFEESVQSARDAEEDDE